MPKFSKPLIGLPIPPRVSMWLGSDMPVAWILVQRGFGGPILCWSQHNDIGNGVGPVDDHWTIHQL